jgi:hypothetical protein
MRFALISIILLAGCATHVSQALPLREGDIVVPHYSFASGPTNYVYGFRDGWIATLRVFAEDIDHQWTLLEVSASGEPSYLDGYFDARREAEVLAQRLAKSLGKKAAQEKLRDAIGNSKSRSSSLQTTSGLRPFVSD